MINEVAPPTQVADVTSLQKDIRKLNQQYEVLLNCRAQDREALQSFQKRVVLQQRQIAILEAEKRELLEHLNPRADTNGKERGKLND